MSIGKHLIKLAEKLSLKHNRNGVAVTVVKE